jgi:hypothetical protein
MYLTGQNVPRIAGHGPTNLVFQPTDSLLTNELSHKNQTVFPVLICHRDLFSIFTENKYWTQELPSVKKHRHVQGFFNVST